MLKIQQVRVTEYAVSQLGSHTGLNRASQTQQRVLDLSLPRISRDLSLERLKQESTSWNLSGQLCSQSHCRVLFRFASVLEKVI